MKCPYCKTETKADDKICPKCKASLEQPKENKETKPERANTKIVEE